MDILEKLKNIFGDGEAPYQQSTLAELLDLKAEQQRARGTSDDPLVRQACSLKIALINPHIDVLVAEEDARRGLAKMSPAAQKAAALIVQNMNQKVRVKHG